MLTNLLFTPQQDRSGRSGRTEPVTFTGTQRSLLFRAHEPFSRQEGIVLPCKMENAYLSSTARTTSSEELLSSQDNFLCFSPKSSHPQPVISTGRDVGALASRLLCFLVCSASPQHVSLVRNSLLTGALLCLLHWVIKSGPQQPVQGLPLKK